MAYEDQEEKRSRVVVDTPTSRREYVRTESTRVPEESGFSGGTVAAIVVGIVALVTIAFLVMYNRQTDSEANLNARMASAASSPQQPVIIQQPAAAPQQPVIIQQPSQPSSQPIIVQAPAPSNPQNQSMPAASNDTGVQMTLDKKFTEDSVLSTAAITADVVNGRVTLTGTVTSDDQKSRAELLAKTVKGVRTVDNQILVSRS